MEKLCLIGNESYPKMIPKCEAERKHVFLKEIHRFLEQTCGSSTYGKMFGANFNCPMQYESSG